MLSFLEEKALEAYFMAEIIVERFIDSTQQLFGRYCEICLLSPESTQKLGKLIERREVKEIRSKNDYGRYCRIKQYNDMLSQNVAVDKEVDDVLSLKHKAFLMLNEYETLINQNSAKSAICDCLVNAADAGSIAISYTLGILQAEGILYDKDYGKATERLCKAADWNDITGLLAILYYAPNNPNKDRYLTALNENLKRTCNSSLIGLVGRTYGNCSGKSYGEIALLEKAFNQGKIKRDVYSKPYARLIFSSIIRKKDKEAYVLSGNKDLFEDVCSLPLKLKANDPKIKNDTLHNDPLLSEYSHKLSEKLRITQSRQQSEYRPLCRVSDRRVVLDYFSEAIKSSMENANIERIEVSDLNESDFEPTQNNIFIRLCDEESTVNTYLLFFEGEIKPKILEQTKKFLRSDNRSMYRINKPCTTLDLSSVLSICFADKGNAKILKDYCDIITVKEFTKSAKAQLIERIVESKRKIYSIDEVAISKEVVSGPFIEFGVDTIASIITDIMSGSDTSKLTINNDMLQPYFNRHGNSNKYGFWENRE